MSGSAKVRVLLPAAVAVLLLGVSGYIFWQRGRSHGELGRQLAQTLAHEISKTTPLADIRVEDISITDIKLVELGRGYVVGGQVQIRRKPFPPTPKASIVLEPSGFAKLQVIGLCDLENVPIDPRLPGLTRPQWSVSSAGVDGNYVGMEELEKVWDDGAPDPANHLFDRWVTFSGYQVPPDNAEFIFMLFTARLLRQSGDFERADTAIIEAMKHPRFKRSKPWVARAQKERKLLDAKSRE